MYSMGDVDAFIQHLTHILQISPLHYLPKEENEVPHSVNGSHTNSVLHQDNECITGRCAETCTVDSSGCVCVLQRRPKQYLEEELLMWFDVYWEAYDVRDNI